MSGTRRRSSRTATALASSPWLLVATGVVVMVVLLVGALAASRGREPETTRPADLPAPVALRFHLEHTGENARPSECAVDGAACAGL